MSAETPQGVPAHLTPAQVLARASFDLDKAMAALPPRPAFSPSTNGGAGTRLRGHLKTTAPDDLLRDFAKDSLRAQRISAKYLEALRVVLGNQAEAERCGFVLEMNRRVPFAAERSMRTIVDQMRDAGFARGVWVNHGAGLTQLVQAFPPTLPEPQRGSMSLEEYQRRDEERADRRCSTADRGSVPDCLQPEDVPF